MNQRRSPVLLDETWMGTVAVFSFDSYHRAKTRGKKHLHQHYCVSFSLPDRSSE